MKRLPRLWLGILVGAVLVGAAFGWSMLKDKQAAGRIRRLSRQYREALRQDNYADGESRLRKVLALTPDNPFLLYDLACVQAKTRQHAEAIATLLQSAQCGFDSWQHAENDPDLQSIRGEETTAEAIALMKNNADKKRDGLVDPYAATSPADCPEQRSAKAIARHFQKKRKPLRKYGRYLGPWPTHESDWRYLCGQIDALISYARNHREADDVPLAYLTVVQTFERLHSPVGFSGYVWPKTAERMAEVVAEFQAAHPEDPLLREAHYVLLQAKWEAALMETWTPGTNQFRITPETRKRFAHDFATLADGAAGEKTEGLSLVKALGLGHASDEPELRHRLLSRLKHRMDEHKEVERLAWKELKVALLGYSGTPDFRVTDTAGKLRTAASYQGKLLVLDFWATWCGPCMRELPGMKELYAEYGGPDVQFLGIALEDGRSMSRQSFEEWCREHDVTWPQVYSGKAWKHPMARQFHITGVPTLVFVNREGKVAGEGRAHSAEHWIRKELGLPPPDCHGSTDDPTDTNVEASDD